LSLAALKEKTMNFLLQHPAFVKDFKALSQVTLNPARHTSANAQEHSIAVAKEALQIAQQNGCTEAECQLLEALGLLHDIGKISGSASASKSVDLLPCYEITDPRLIALVHSHDVNLPWWISSQKGEAPSDKAWRKLVAKVDLRLLCLFMVADRVDCPGGWRANKPLVWFLTEAKRRGLLSQELSLPEGHEEPIVEHCAGGVLRRQKSGSIELLVLKMRGNTYELPKGHIEPNETAQEAAARELFEETGLTVEVKELLGSVEYPLHDIIGNKQVQYFLCESNQDTPTAANLEPRWIQAHELDALPLISEALRSLLQKGFTQ
jgi:8-oxo-dGTP pyrophosphatase MutT (NUDIX family)